MIKYLIHSLLLLFSFMNDSYAETFSLPTAQTVLDPRAAFIPALSLTDDALAVEWQIAPGYYLYKDKTKIYKVSPDKRTRLQPTFATGELVNDQEFGPQTVYRHYTVMTIDTPIYRRLEDSTALEVIFQGCKEGRLCYPPTTVTLSLPDYP